jgi:membrane associated rhomboid family serine protease
VLDDHLAKMQSRSKITSEDLEQILGAVRPHEDFHWYQLITHAFLHGGIMHLAGNLLFLIVLGTRVNSLLGNLLTAILYPVLAIAAGLAQMIASAHQPPAPMIGASGAIMGLAGMYLVLFPVHKVYMSIWMRWGLIAGFKLSWKVWAVRGFWVVLFYIAFDVRYTSLGVKDHVAHWAHLGGFITGIAIAIGLLLARLSDAHGGDMLSVVLGRHAWALIGRPSSRVAKAITSNAPPVPGLVVTRYPV